jgi:two-component system, sensor histidine kinase
LQDRERLREEKFAIEHRMAAVLDSVTDAVFEVDRTWRVVFVNERADTLLGEGRTGLGQFRRQIATTAV